MSKIYKSSNSVDVIGGVAFGGGGGGGGSRRRANTRKIAAYNSEPKNGESSDRMTENQARVLCDAAEMIYPSAPGKKTDSDDSSNPVEGSSHPKAKAGGYLCQRGVTIIEDRIRPREEYINGLHEKYLQ